RHRVAGEDLQALVGKQRHHLLGETLDAGAAGDEGLLGLAGRALLRQRRAVPTMVAYQLAAETVLDQPGAAMRALQAMAAGAAERARSATAPAARARPACRPDCRSRRLPA